MHATALLGSLAFSGGVHALHLPDANLRFPLAS